MYWSSDVCSSDLRGVDAPDAALPTGQRMSADPHGAVPDVAGLSPQVGAGTQDDRCRRVAGRCTHRPRERAADRAVGENLLDRHREPVLGALVVDRVGVVLGCGSGELLDGGAAGAQIGGAWGRGRVCRDGEISVRAVSFKKKKDK